MAFIFLFSELFRPFLKVIFQRCLQLGITHRYYFAHEKKTFFQILYDEINIILFFRDKICEEFSKNKNVTSETATKVPYLPT
jgi:hypothetical protein